MTKTKSSEATIEFDGHDLNVWFDGKKIAKRGHKGTPQAMQWISLEPGYIVNYEHGYDQIVIRHSDPQRQ
jgi:hypothetical protein